MQDNPHYDAIRYVLKDEIVNPLRQDKFVRADRVLKLREMLQEICSVKGLTSEEKDPEEFLNILLAETLKADPFLKVSMHACERALYGHLFVCVKSILCLFYTDEGFVSVFFFY